MTGVIPKKMIGMRATAAAAAMVRMLTDMARVESGIRTNTAIAPPPINRPIAEASAIMKPITLRRCWSSGSAFGFGDDFFN